MGFRFFRRVKVLPGVWINFSRSGASLSVGGRGARFTVGPRGTRATIGIPGTGLYYTTTSGSRRRASRRPPAGGGVEVRDRLRMSFWRSLVASEGEKAFVDAMRRLAEGDAEGALARVSTLPDEADACLLAGFLALGLGRYTRAERAFRRALERPERLSRLFERYGVDVRFDVPVTDEVLAHVEPGRRGAWLGLAEALQRKGDREGARRALERLARLDRNAGDDPVVRLSLAELLCEEGLASGPRARRVLDLTAQPAGDRVLDAALSLYRARAFRALGLPVAARDTLTRALRRRRGLPPELVRALRLERAEAYREAGALARARREWEALLAEDPTDAEVRSRLGLPREGGEGR